MYAILAGASMLISIWLALKSVKAEEMTINDSINGITVYLNKMDGETAGDVWSGVGYLKDLESREKKAEEKGFIAKLGEALEKKTAILHHPYIRAVIICAAVLLAVICIYFWIWLAKHGL